MGSKKGNSGGFFHKAVAKQDRSGLRTHNYFGPKGQKDHGHVVVRESGKVDYKRDFRKGK